MILWSLLGANMMKTFKLSFCRKCINTYHKVLDVILTMKRGIGKQDNRDVYANMDMARLLHQSRFYFTIF